MDKPSITWRQLIAFATSLMVAQGSIAVFGKDNVLDMVAQVVATEVLQQMTESATCTIPKK
jgi:hypothetical protein